MKYPTHKGMGLELRKKLIFSAHFLAGRVPKALPLFHPRQRQGATLSSFTLPTYASQIVLTNQLYPQKKYMYHILLASFFWKAHKKLL